MRGLRIGDGVLAGVLALAAIGAWALTRTYPNYDAYFHLVWGRELMHGSTPSFEAYAAPTEHPLFVGLAAVLGLVGRAGERLLVLATALSLAALAVAVVRLGRIVLGRWAGVAAAVFVLTSSSLLLYAAKAYVDLPFLAAAAWAAVLEAERPRRGVPVMALLAVAGLLRPEAWLLIAAYLAWCWPTEKGARPLFPSRAALVALAAVAPLGWALVDLAVTGDALHSLHATGKLAEDLSRGKHPGALPGAFVSFLGTTLRPPVLALGVVGMALALWRRGWRDLAIPLALVGAGTLTFVATGLAGLSVLPRYLTLPAVGLALFAGYALTGWMQLDARDRWRAPWRLGAFAAIALAVAAAAILLPGAARKLNREVRFVRSTHDELQSLLHRPAVRRCPPIVFPTYRLVPDARWLLDAPRGTVVARPGTRAQTGVRIYVRGSHRAVSRLGRAAGVSPATNVRDPRFRFVTRAGPLEAFARCG